MLLVVLVSIVQAAIVWAVAIGLRKGAATEVGATTLRRFVSVFVIAELAVLVATVVIAGFTQVHERYLLVLLPPVGLWSPSRFGDVRRRSFSGRHWRSRAS